MGAGEGASSAGPTVVSYANYTYAQCFGFEAIQQVDCVQQMLNVTDPPSIYDYFSYTQLWEPLTCLLMNTTLYERADDAATFNYCTVPRRGFDAFLFVSLGLLLTSVLFGKLSAVWVLIAGGVLGAVNYYANLLHVSNSIALWLSIQPADLFFYAFLPPLLVDQAIRIDFFMFRKIWVHALLMAFVLVVLSAIALTPFILFVLGFAQRGWSWVHGGLLSAIIAPTDALAVAAILARANGPERVVTIMEGECLFNDASAITLFEVFAHLIYVHASESPPVWPSVWSVIPTILIDILRLSAVGVGIGLAMSLATGYILRWLRWRGAQPYIETTVVLAVAYLSFYVTNSPARGSGVIAVVVFGLYGNATSKWGMLATDEESGAFDAVWDMISFSANGLVFFWSGVASINFFIRSITLTERSVMSYIAIPCVYVFMILFRALGVALFNPIFKIMGEGLSPAEIFFVGWAGLRGSVSLILVSSFTTGSFLTLANPDESAAVNADISLWASSFVALTLIINGPLIAPILSLLRLNRVPREKLKIRARAKRALGRFTEQQLVALKEDDDEFLQGANWEAVAHYVDISDALEDFDVPAEPIVKDATLEEAQTASTTIGVYKTLGKGTLLGLEKLLLCWPLCRRKADKVPQPPDASHHGLKRTTSSVLRRTTAQPRDSLAEQGSNGFKKSSPGTTDSTIGDGSFTGGSSSPGGPSGASGNAYEPWAETFTAEELAHELEDECPFLPPGIEVEEGSDGGGADGGGGGDVEMGLVPTSAVTGSMVRPRSSSSLSPITEGKVMSNAQFSTAAPPAAAAAVPAEEDQVCLTGSAGAKMLSELRKSISAKPLLPPEYYASLPSAVGAKMAQELSRELSQSGQGPGGGGAVLPKPAAAASPAVQPPTAGAETPEYYSSLPAQVGRAMQAELQAALQAKAAGEEAGAASQAATVTTAATQAAAQLISGVPDETGDYYSSMPAAVGRSMREDLQRKLKAEQQQQQQRQPDIAPLPQGTAAIPPLQLRRLSGSATTSVPAGAGKAMAAELQRRLRKGTHSRGPSTDLTAGSSPRAGTPRLSTGRPPEWEYHKTVSGVSGANLALELREQMRSVPQASQERDLLGRRRMATPRGGEGLASDAPSGVGASPKSGVRQLGRSATGAGAGLTAGRPPSSTRFDTSSGILRAATPMSEALLDRKKSNLHALRRSATATAGVGRSQRTASISHDVDASPFTSVGPTLDASTSGVRSVRPSPSMLRSSKGPGGLEPSRSGAVHEASANLLKRTFSVGDSLHKRNKPVAVVGDDDDFGEDVSEEELRGGAAAKSDGAGASYPGSRMGGRSVSAATMHDGSLAGDVDAEKPVTLEDDDAEMLAEMRTRLLAGMKRHFVGKRLAGLLSVEGLRILQYSCDHASDHSNRPLQMWAALENEVRGGWTTRLASRLSIWITRGYRKMPALLQRILSWPFKTAASLLRRSLGRKMLVACEVAVEYYMALLGSPQIQWLKSHGDECWRLLDEIDAESDAAHHFIIEREIEAPDRFQAIQSYRAAMALLRQQVLFIGELFETGMVDEAEQRMMVDPVDRKLRHLELVGPVWRPPRPKMVLRGLPFMSVLPDPAFRRVWESGSLVEFRKGQCIWTASDLVRRTGGAQGPGGFVVLSGVVKRVHMRPDGSKKEYFQGAGGVVGVLLCTTGTKLPGTELAIAEGNALGKGPLVFHIPQTEVRRVQGAASAGDPYMIELEEELARLSATYVVESLDVELVATVVAHLQAVLGPNAGERGLGRTRGASVPHLHGAGGSLGGPLGRRATVDAALPHARSVGANLAAMMQQIALMEYEEDDYDEEEEEEEGWNDEEYAPMSQLGRRSVHSSRLRLQEEAQQPRLALGRRSVHSSKVRLAQRSFEEDRGQPESGGGDGPPVTSKSRAGSPQRRGVHFSSEGHNDSLQQHHEDEEQRAVLASAMVRAPQLAADVSMEVRKAVPYAFIMRLPAGAVFVQTSHAVLIRGELTPRGQSPDAKPLAAPCTLPWLWQERWVAGVGSTVPLVESLEWFIGSQGAMLVVCHNPDGGVPDAVNEWANQQPQPEEPHKDITSFPLNGSATSPRESFGMKASSSVSGSEQGSLTGGAAAAMGAQLRSLFRRSVTFS